MTEKNHAEYHFPATIDSMRPFLAKAKELMLAWTSDQKMVGRIEVALEELFVNITLYAYQNNKPGSVQFHFSVFPDQRMFLMQLIDNGIPFDPVQKLQEERAEQLREMELGGHGIKIASQFVDKIDYQRHNSQNVLSLYKSY